MGCWHELDVCVLNLWVTACALAKIMAICVGFLENMVVIFVEVLPSSSIPFTFTKTEWSLSPELSLVAFLQ